MKRSNLLLLGPMLLAVPLYLALSSRKNTEASTDLEQKLFNNVMAWHKDVGAPLSESPDVFLATHFTKNRELVARSCGLYRTRYVALVEESKDGMDFLPGGRLKPAQMAQISKLIKTLPPTRKPQQWRDMLIFTFLDGKRKRHTRLYNRASLPPQVRAIYRITGAPLAGAKQ